ncbi:MAG TPA: glycoside hydrolase family 31 protein, partial [Rubrobacteraceae bacterium]|nr:glycoside hydrolase family 31 protein [Rubrobacteraceae bacterium]
PLSGIYHGRGSSIQEHNLYPLSYNKAVAEITEQITGNGAIYARSAWAGSQRYPLHWSGDPENTDSAMAGTLRGGLSVGLSGFSFWSHFIGGFAYPSPENLYRRWLAFGALCSHARCHGAPPTEPWEYGEEFTDDFRRTVELRYRLMPYVYAQAKLASREGHPMVRALFFEYPEDRTSWLVEDQYLFGTDLLVAPLLESKPVRDVYLPPGPWTDYQTGETFAGERWHSIGAGEIPAILLVRGGAAIPHIQLAQCTDRMDWSEIELAVYSVNSSTAEGLFCLPEDGELRHLRLQREGDGFALKKDPSEQDRSPFSSSLRWWSSIEFIFPSASRVRALPAVRPEVYGLVQKTQQPLPVLWMLVGPDVPVSVEPPEGGSGVGLRQRLGVLEGHELVVSGVDDHEGDAFAGELSGLLHRPHGPGIYPQEMLTSEEDAWGEEGRQAADIGDPLP